MPIYELTPVNIDDPNWQHSSHREICRVHAQSEEYAREYAGNEFRPASERDIPLEGQPQSPWEDQRHSRCVSGDELFGPTEWDGRIEISGETDVNNWIVIVEGYRRTKGDEQVDGGWGSGRWGKSSWGGSKSPEPRSLDSIASVDELSDFDTLSETGATGPAEGNPTSIPQYADVALEAIDDAIAEVTAGGGANNHLVTIVTASTVESAIADRAVLTFQASLLLEFLDQLVGPDGVSVDQRNAPSMAEALGIDNAATADELLDVLRELRDELRRFNDALESASLQAEGLSELQKIGLKALDRFAQTAAIGGAGLFIAGLGGLLDSAGVVSWDKAIEFVKAVRG